jgi:hypothetical protein
MASNQRPQPYDWRPTGSIRPASGPLLADAPADVIATEINDPFGVAAMQQKAPGAN